MRPVCFDTSVIIKLFVVEERSDQAEELFTEAMSARVPILAPAFAWAEVGSILRKKVRQGLLSLEEAEQAWRDFIDLPITYVNSTEIMRLAWSIASQYNLPTIYDAVFLATAETAPDGPADFWTSDSILVKTVRGHKRYVKELLRQTEPN